MVLIMMSLSIEEGFFGRSTVIPETELRVVSHSAHSAISIDSE
jgi:hypothetical protein